MHQVPRVIRALTAAGCTAATLLLPTTSAGASSTQSINLLRDCIGDNGTGAINVPAGLDIVVDNPGWAAGTLGGANTFLANQSTTETIATDGSQTTIDLSPTWSTPVFIATTNPGLGFWLLHEGSSDLGQLRSGQVVVVTWLLNLDHPTMVVYPPAGTNGRPILAQGQVDSPLTCTITAN